MRRIAVLFFLVLTLTAQGRRKPSVKRADRYFAKTAYFQAKEEYTRLLRGRHTPKYINQQVALCYDHLGLAVQAAQFYAKSIEQDPNLPVEWYYRLAYNLNKNGRYEAAEAAMSTFANRATEDPRAHYFLQQAKAYPTQGSTPSNYYVEEAGINDLFYGDHSLSWSTTDTLLFVSNRTKYSQKWLRRLFEAREKGTQMPNTALYETRLLAKDEPLREHHILRGPINRRFTEGQATMHTGGNLIYFTSESYRNRKFRKNKAVKKRQGRMGLFWAERKGKKWKKIKVLPFVQAEYTYVDPFVTPQGDYLYFASDQAGTVGELDLWRVAILEDGKTFGTPENLGAHINTGFNERYPFISADRILYFTSDRWGGYGGLDIYALDLKDDTAQPKNLGEGINTPKDDFNFVYNSTLDYGFLSTNRIGRQDIYRVKPKCDAEVKGVVRDAETQAKLTDVTVVLVDASRQVLTRLQTDREGQFTAVLPCDKTYQIQVVKEGYYYKEEEHRTPKEAEAVLNISLKKQEKLHIQDNKILVNDIPFAFDQATITTEGARELDRLVALMVENKTMRILIVAHTDRVGKEKYNKKLAQARAKATAQYLFDHGIAQDRVEAKGVGSSEPKVDCSTCTEFEDQQNRRSEFIILQP